MFKVSICVIVVNRYVWLCQKTCNTRKEPVFRYDSNSLVQIKIMFNLLIWLRFMKIMINLSRIQSKPNRVKSSGAVEGNPVKLGNRNAVRHRLWFFFGFLIVVGGGVGRGASLKKAAAVGRAATVAAPTSVRRVDRFNVLRSALGSALGVKVIDRIPLSPF